MTATVNGTVVQGPEAFLEATRAYWKAIMCRDVEGHMEAQTLLPTLSRI